MVDFFKNSIGKVGFVLVFIFSIAAALVYYQKTYGMEVIPTLSINDPALEAKVLVASQGSDYKREVVANILDTFRESDVYIKVIDATQLTDVQAPNWDAIVILHTWEMWKPQLNAAVFIKRTVDKDKLIILATSSGGEEMMEEVDGISSASVLSATTKDSQQIIQSIRDVLKDKYHRSYSSVLEEY